MISPTVAQPARNLQYEMWTMLFKLYVAYTLAQDVGMHLILTGILSFLCKVVE